MPFPIETPPATAYLVNRVSWKLPKEILEKALSLFREWEETAFVITWILCTTMTGGGRRSIPVTKQPAAATGTVKIRVQKQIFQDKIRLETSQATTIHSARFLSRLTLTGIRTRRGGILRMSPVRLLMSLKSTQREEAVRRRRALLRRLAQRIRQRQLILTADRWAILIATVR